MKSGYQAPQRIDAVYIHVVGVSSVRAPLHGAIATSSGPQHPLIITSRRSDKTYWNYGGSDNLATGTLWKSDTRNAGMDTNGEDQQQEQCQGERRAYTLH